MQLFKILFAHVVLVLLLTRLSHGTYVDLVVTNQRKVSKCGHTMTQLATLNDLCKRGATVGQEEDHAVITGTQFMKCCLEIFRQG